MHKVTYQTKVPLEIHEECEFTAKLWGDVERNLYKDVLRHQPINDLKRNYQVIYGTRCLRTAQPDAKSLINARQFNSIHASLKGKMRSRDESHLRHIKQVIDQIDGLKKSISKAFQNLESTASSCRVDANQTSSRHSIKRAIHQKKRKLHRLEQKLVKLQSTKPRLTFGGHKLWAAQFNLAENGYLNHEEWLKEWRDTRASQFILVGSSDETAGFQNCQMTPEGNLKIKVAPMLEQVNGYVRSHLWDSVCLRPVRY